MKYNWDNHVFMDNKKILENQLLSNYLIDTKANVAEVDRGIVLPIRGKFNGFEIDASGGICDSTGNFVAGHKTQLDELEFVNWRRCIKSYKVDKKPIFRDEVVVFGGILIKHFGHMITECISRLWFFAKNNTIKYKFIFLNYENNSIIYNEDILNAIGLKKEQYEVINEVTQFKKIIVPEQSLYLRSGFRKEQKFIYDAMISNIEPFGFKKVYLSKSKFNKNSSKRESYFEEFYRKRDFEIIYPETLTFLEQVAILNGADEVVSSEGTLVHLNFFRKPKGKLTILLRHTERKRISPAPLFSSQMRELEIFFVDVTYNFLPTSFNCGEFFFGPTKHWINYLNFCNIAYTPDEISFDIHIKPYVYDYLLNWAKHYNKTPGAYATIKNQTLPDLIKSIHRTFIGENIDIKNFPERVDVVKMQNQIKELTATIEKQKLQLEEQKQSVDLKENIKEVVTQMGLLEAHQKLARQTEDKFNIVRNIVTKMEDNLKISDKDLEEKCEILKDQVKKQNEKIKILEERFIELEENSKSKGLFGKK